MHRSIRGLLAAALASVALAACQTTLMLNTDQLEQGIQEQIQSQTGLTVTGIECPDRPIQQGDQFDCTVTTSDGQQLTVNVTQTDDQGNVNWRLN